MNELVLFFVGFYKHGGIQSLISGPFSSYEKAEDDRQFGHDDISNYRTVRITIPITQMEIL